MLRIRVMNHQPFPFKFGNDVVRPFIIGSDDLIGENITEKQQFLGERCHYWVWKNDTESDYVGFQIRRRVFLFQPMVSRHDAIWSASCAAHADPSAQIVGVTAQQFVSYLAGLPGDDESWRWIEDWDIVVPRPLMLGMSLGEHYRRNHRAHDWEIFSSILRKYDLDDGRMPYLTAFHSFIMRGDIFRSYMPIYWEIIQEAERLVERPASGDDSRVFGFLTERLFTVWLHRLKCERPKLRILTLPVLFGQMA